MTLLHIFGSTVELCSRRVIMIQSSVPKPRISSASVSALRRQFYVTCAGSSDRREQNYENAVSTLNELQSNYSVLQNSIKNKHQDSKHISDTLTYLGRLGISSFALDSLPAIHVSGSKGKGSTCAMVESILRKNGYRTGFFSSPHLIAVTERIRLDGVPIDNERFTEHFWNIYNRLMTTRDCMEDLPSYFCFLTLMAIEVFLHENVDVCVFEVGIGGRYDSTNVLRKTQTVGLTSLSLEHTQLLGETLEEIAWQKAGIIKAESDVFTTSQPTECLEVIQEECNRMKAKLHIAPSRLDEYDWLIKPSLMNETCAAMELNISLAVQIASNWINRTRPEAQVDLRSVPKSFTEGIDHCFWPGRLQTVPFGDRRTLYMDGAHTIESIAVCANWFVSKTLCHHKKILIFNTTGERDSYKLLSTLSCTAKFDAAYFTPNFAFCSATRADTVNHNFPPEQQLHRAEKNCILWKKQLGHERGFMCGSVDSVFKHIDELYPPSSYFCDILITGSIHLLGATLTALNLEKYAYNATNKK